MSLLKEKVSRALEKVRPQVQAHGGDLKLVGVKNGQVTIKILGACLGCPMAQATFGAGMEEFIKEEIPEVKKIKFIT
ncbi:MAG: NifU family protein [Patescibacteria group bacterium]